jgi:hypothetical protein
MIELLERQKKLTANQWKLICTANVADLLDFFDFFLIGYVTAALTKESLAGDDDGAATWRRIMAAVTQLGNKTAGPGPLMVKI